MRQTKTNIIVDGIPLVEDRLSGVGHSLLYTLKALEKNQGFKDNYQLVILAPGGRLDMLKRWNFRTAQLKGLPIKLKIINILTRLNLLPPVDLLFGRGIYLFFNFRNWPLAQSRSITYFHDICYAIFPQFVSPRNQRYLIHNAPRWIRRTNMIVTVSETSKKEMAEYYGLDPSRLRVVYNGVDTSVYFRQTAEEVGRIKNKYSIEGDYAIYLGNIEPRKNLKRLLDAWHLLPELILNQHTLVLIGGGGWLNNDVNLKIHQLIQSGVKIIWPESYVPDEDLPALLSGAKAMLYPTLHEGFGIPPLESMACGTPVLVSANGALPEIIGQAALYANAEDVVDIKNKTEQLLTDQKLQEDLIEKGNRKVLEYSWEKSAQLVLAIINEESRQL